MGASASLLIATIDFGGAHAGLMLNRAADAVGDVQIGRDGLAGLTDLMRVRNPARIDSGTARADGGAQRLRQFDDRREAFRSAHAASAGHDDARIVETHFAFAFHRKAQRLGHDLIFAQHRRDGVTSPVLPATASGIGKARDRVVMIIGVVFTTTCDNNLPA